METVRAIQPPRGGDTCLVIQDIPLVMGGYFHLKFSAYGSAFNLHSGRWVAFSEFLSFLKAFQDRIFKLTKFIVVKKLLAFLMVLFVKVQINIKSQSK